MKNNCKIVTVYECDGRECKFNDTEHMICCEFLNDDYIPCRCTNPKAINEAKRLEGER